MSSTRLRSFRHRTARHATLTMTAGLAICLVVSSCSSDPPAPDRGKTLSLKGGVTLTAPAGSLPAGAKISARPATEHSNLGPELLEVASIDVVTTKQPTMPVTLTIPVPRSSYANLPAAIDLHVPVVHQPDEKPQELLEGTLDRLAGTVTVTTTSLSPFGVHLPSLDALNQQILKIVNGITGSVFFNANDPSCSGEKAVRNAGYTITSTSSRTVKWCLGQDSKGQPDAPGRREPALPAPRNGQQRTLAKVHDRRRTACCARSARDGVDQRAPDDPEPRRRD